MAHLLSGVKEANYIANVMSYAACVGPNKDLCDKKKTKVATKDCRDKANGGTKQFGYTALLLLTTVYLIHCFY